MLKWQRDVAKSLGHEECDLPAKDELIQFEFITNEVTGERRLYFRHRLLPNVPSGTVNQAAQWGQWQRVLERTLDEASMNDLVESGGIFQEDEK